jgi:hypothetical protein
VTRCFAADILFSTLLTLISLKWADSDYTCLQRAKQKNRGNDLIVRSLVLGLKHILYHPDRAAVLLV